MRFSTAAAAALVLPAGSALATTFQVVLGMNGTLTYSPTEIDGAQVGDTVTFTL